MKTVRSISILFLLITITLVSKATTTEEYSPNFQAEENEIYSAFSEIDPVISYMEENSDATANEVSSLFPMASINYNDNFEYFLRKKQTGSTLISKLLFLWAAC
jgi:hypothetical protein